MRTDDIGLPQRAFEEVQHEVTAMDGAVCVLAGEGQHFGGCVVETRLSRQRSEDKD